MNKIHSFKVVMFILLLAVSVYAQQDKPEQTRTEAEKTTKTRTELLNELSLRAAQVDLEHAKEAHDRYKNEYEDAKRLFK